MNLRKITEQFIVQTGLRPLVSAEVEFYLPSGVQCAAWGVQLEQAGVETYGFERERGENQYELALKTPDTPMRVVEQINLIKQIITSSSCGLPQAGVQDLDPAQSLCDSQDDGGGKIFAAKPYVDQPGSGLHIHLSLLDENGVNRFAKTGEEESPAMRHAVAGLLGGMLEGFAIFAPFPESYARFVPSPQPSPGGRGGSKDNHAPVNVSWGGNNRTTAVRIPASTAWPAGRHIEHRVAGADADPALVIGAILLAVARGLKEGREPLPKIWGNAADPQYGPLPPFPKTLEEARKMFNKTGLYDALGL